MAPGRGDDTRGGGFLQLSSSPAYVSASADDDTDEEDDGETARLSTIKIKNGDVASAADGTVPRGTGRRGRSVRSASLGLERVASRRAGRWGRGGAATQTAAYTVGFVVLGFMVGLIGPTLPALRENVGVSFARLGVIFLARWVGGVVGSLVGGWLLERAPGSHAPYAASVLVASLGCVLIPTAVTLPGLLAAFLVMVGPGLTSRGSLLCAGGGRVF